MKLKYKKWFRLLKNNKLVGYKRITHYNQHFYSIDNYGWTGKEIIYDKYDKFANLYDLNNRPLFINDIIMLCNLLDHQLINKHYLISKLNNNAKIQLLPINDNTNDIITDISLLNLNKNNIKFIEISE